ncbi:hypothetical protein VG539_004111 [Cronobacter muytjensii]|uniref:hypothetical protein n=1 Tax=Cronobacter muytjensii TaxID=413501 RepID=UPI0024A9EF30|nr:hypothetical protein [Cronobacter muytjensii]ELY3985296.1 hypothetical protein [Cronobacter muytjensii]MDI6457863.1 hypothetical protein [Cronobacter muytjensii]
MKSLHFIVPVLFVGLLAFMVIKSNRIDREEKEILKDPVYQDAEVIGGVPGTPSPKGIVNLRLTYKYTAHTGEVIIKENVLTAVKTMDMQKFNVGSIIPIIYQRDNPHKSMLKKVNIIDV